MNATNVVRAAWGRLVGGPAPARAAGTAEPVGDNILERLARLEEQMRRRAVYVGDHECLAVLRSGHKIYVDTRDIGIASHLMIDGHWEPWVARVLLPLVRPGMRVCDIGANFGYYTLQMAAAVGSSGHVWAVEANPRMTYLLNKSLLVNGLAPRATLLELAAWDGDTAMDFVVTDSLSGGGRVRERASQQPGQLRVKASPLDTVIDGSLDVIKIDVEGAEERALAGMTRIIDASPSLAIVMEYYAPAFADPVAFFERFAARGFKARAIHPMGLGPVLPPHGLVADLGGELTYVLMERRPA